MKAVEGGFLQLNLCYSICSGLGQEVNDRALGTYIWKQHVSKDFINPAVKGEKRRGKKWGRKGLIMGGWERTTKGHCRLFLTWRNNIFSCQGQTLIIIAKTCLPSSYESSRYWILLSGQDLGEDNRGIQYALNVPHTPCLVFLVCNIPAYVYILFAVSFRLQLAGEGACTTQMKEWAEQKLRYAGDLCVACVRAYVCVYVCVCIRINFSSLGRGVLWMVFVFTSFVLLLGSAGVWNRDLVHARHAPRHCTIRLLRILFLCYCSISPDAGFTASKFSKLFFCLLSCFFLSLLECLCQWVGNEFRSRRRVWEYSGVEDQARTRSSSPPPSSYCISEGRLARGTSEGD